MPSEFFSFNIDTSQADSFLGELTARLQGLDPLYEQIANDLVQPFINDRFDTETDPSGQPWADLKPATIAQRERKKLVPIRKLDATGRGRKNVKAVPVSGGVQVVYGGENTEYMEVHQDGSKKRNIPQRRIIPTQQEIEGAIGQQIQEAAESYLNPGFGRFVRGELRRTARLFRR